MRTHFSAVAALAVLTTVAVVAGGGSGPAPAGQARDACKTIQRALDNQNDILASTEADLSNQYRERNLLDALINQMPEQGMNKDALSSAMSEASHGEVLPKALRQWIDGLDRYVLPQSVTGRRGATQSRIDRLIEDEQQSKTQIRKLRQQQVELDCPTTEAGGTAAPPVEGSTPAPGAGGGTRPPTTSAGPSGTTTAPAELKVAPQDWNGDWTHEFGLLILQPEEHADQVGYIADEQLGAANVMGPAVTCDRKGLYRGEIQWDRTGVGFAAGYRGKVFACTNGNTLEGKFTNYGEGAALVQSATFTLTMSDKDKKAFSGQLRAYTPTTRSSGNPTSWSGKR